jgi:hypothetical protein
MAERGELKYTVKFDKDTKALKDVSTELKNVEKQGDKAAKSMGGIGTSMGGIANAIAGIGIGVFLFDTIKRAAAGTDAMNELKETFDETAGVLIEVLEPALELVSSGLQGLLVTVQGAIKAFKTLIAGDFQASIDQFLDAIAAGGERAQGLTKASERVQSKIILEEAKIRVRDVRLSGEEKLKMVKEAEVKSLKILRESGEFALFSQKQKAKAELEIRKEIATEIEAAEREMSTQEKERALASIQILRLKIADERATKEERLEMLAEIQQRELELIEADASGKFIAEETLAARRLAVQQRFVNAKDKLNATEIKGNQVLIQSAASAAAKELEISGNAANAARAAGAKAIKDAANSAAKIITVKGAEATARALANPPGPPFTIPQAVATAALYTGLAATVSAVGGAVAGKVAPPSGGGAEAAPAAPEGPLGAPAPVGIAGAGGDGAVTTAAAGAAPTAAGTTIIVDQLIVNVENVSDVRYIDILIDSVNKAVTLRGQTLIATELQ